MANTQIQMDRSVVAFISGVPISYPFGLIITVDTAVAPYSGWIAAGHCHAQAGTDGTLTAGTKKNPSHPTRRAARG